MTTAVILTAWFQLHHLHIIWIINKKFMNEMIEYANNTPEQRMTITRNGETVETPPKHQKKSPSELIRFFVIKALKQAPSLHIYQYKLQVVIFSFFACGQLACWVLILKSLVWFQILMIKQS